MTYNVFSGTLNLTQSINVWWDIKPYSTNFAQPLKVQFCSITFHILLYSYV